MIEVHSTLVNTSINKSWTLPVMKFMKNRQALAFELNLLKEADFKVISPSFTSTGFQLEATDKDFRYVAIAIKIENDYRRDSPLITDHRKPNTDH